MIMVWIFALIGLFVVSVAYFTFTEPVITLFTALETYGLPATNSAMIMKCYSIAFIILACGIILYALIASTRHENDSYRI